MSNKYSLEQYGNYGKCKGVCESAKSRREAAEKGYYDLIQTVGKLEIDFTQKLSEGAEGKPDIGVENRLKVDLNAKKAETTTALMELETLRRVEESLKQKFDGAKPEAHQAACAAALKDFKPVFSALIKNYTEASKLHQKIRDIYSELGETGVPWNLLFSVQNLFYCTGKCDLGAPDQQGSMLSEIVRWGKDKEILD